MSAGESKLFGPNADIILNDMLRDAIGWESPVTDRAWMFGAKAVQARLDRAKEIFDGAPVTDERPYDSQAMYVLTLRTDGQERSQFDPARRRELIDSLPPSATQYFEFLNDELVETFGANSIRMHHEAPSDMTPDQLEVMAEDLRTIGWKAEVAPLDEARETSPLGIKIESDGIYGR